MILTLPPHLTLAQLDEFMPTVREAARAAELTIDAGANVQIDTAALQVLVALVRPRKTVAWQNSAPIQSMVRSSGLAAELKLDGGTT